MRFAVLAIALGAIVFAGCSKDDDDGGSDSNSSLVGEWDWPEEHVTFTFSADGKWSAYDYEYAHEDCSGTYIYDEEKTIIYLTYVPATDEPIWGRRWELRNDISSILKVEVYDEDGYQGTMTLTRKKQ